MERNKFILNIFDRHYNLNKMKKIRFSFTSSFTVIILAASLSTFAQTPVRKVLLEEFTTASCGNCPMMSKYINNWHLANAGSTILIAIHEGSGHDAMSNATSDVIFRAMHASYGWFAPAIMIDRGIYPYIDSIPYLSCYKAWGSAPNPGNDTIATRLMNEPAKVGVGINGTYNAATRTIDVTVNAKFVSSVPSGDWRINLFLVEDSVVGYPGLGAFVGWDQHCYDANWANTNYPGMFDKTSIIGYPHRHVMRKAMLGDWGKQGVIPSVPVMGTNYSSSVSFIVDTAYKPKNLSLVAFVSSYGPNKSQKFVLNANDIKLTSAFNTGIGELGILNRNSGSFIENVFPIPSNGQTKIIYTLAKNGISEITVRTIFGQSVEILNSSYHSGQHEITFDASKYSKGIYFISLNTAEGSTVKKFIVE